MKKRMQLLTIGLLAVGAFHCGKKSDKDAAEKLGEDFANSLIFGVTRDEYKAAKADYDQGKDPHGKCLEIDTYKLGKIKTPEAEALSKDVKTLCKGDGPARARSKKLDEHAAEVESDRKEKSGMLRSSLVLLRSDCNDADKFLTNIRTEGLADLATVKTLEQKKAAACTEDVMKEPEKTAAKGAPKAAAAATKK